MSERILVLGDGQDLVEDLQELNLDFAYIDLRKGIQANEIMDIYESLHPEMITSLRSEIETYDFDRIVVVGKSAEYRWNGTIVTRIFGQFNSWLGQYQNPCGKTVIKVKGNETPLIAIDSMSDWSLVNEA